MYEKVGRLKPDEENESNRVIVDELGEIGRISRERMVTGIKPLLSTSSVVIELRIGEEMNRVLGWQVRGMMEKWPRKKAGVWKES